LRPTGRNNPVHGGENIHPFLEFKEVKTKEQAIYTEGIPIFLGNNVWMGSVAGTRLKYLFNRGLAGVARSRAQGWFFIRFFTTF
jgi:hypothetical protein